MREADNISGPEEMGEIAARAAQCRNRSRVEFEASASRKTGGDLPEEGAGGIAAAGLRHQHEFVKRHSRAWSCGRCCQPTDVPQLDKGLHLTGNRPALFNRNFAGDAEPLQPHASPSSVRCRSEERVQVRHACKGRDIASRRNDKMAP